MRAKKYSWAVMNRFPPRGASAGAFPVTTGAKQSVAQADSGAFRGRSPFIPYPDLLAFASRPAAFQLTAVRETPRAASMLLPS